MKHIIYLALLVTSSFAASAEEKGHIGFAVNVLVEGLFSPKLSSVKVIDVIPDSPAELAGIVAGQEILSIDGCKIPGCPASKGKDLINRKPGEFLPLLIRKVDGEQVLVNIHVK